MSHFHDPKPLSPNEKRKELIKDALTLLLAIFIVGLSFFILNPWSQSVIDEARQDRQIQNNTQLIYHRGVIQEISFENQVEDSFTGVGMLEQNLQVQIVEGEKKDQIIPIKATLLNGKAQLEKGYGVIIQEKISPDGQSTFTFSDIYRMERVIIFVVFFVILVIILSGLKGLSSFLSLIFSIIILVQFMLPQVILGTNIFWITLISCSFIVLISIFLSHGFDRKSLVAVSSIMLTIVIAVAISSWAVAFTRLTGMGTEEAFFLAANQKNQFLDFQGILLAGIVIGTIGVLDDVTITQAATVKELNEANPLLTSGQLFWSAMNVGREHVVSMVNTLAMAYAGGALPLLLLLTLGSGSPLWVILNNEIIVEEIVRTTAGSIGLLLAVPITTILAAKFLRTKKV